MAALTGEQIREAARNATMPRKLITVPGLGDVWVRGMSGKERDKHEESMRIKFGRKAGQSDLRNFRAKRATQLIVDEEGHRILNDGDADLLGNLTDAVLDQILGEVAELSGQGEEANADLGNASANPAASGASS
jgi:hypothetical protein